MKISDRVETCLGSGTVIGFDLPESFDKNRVIVELDENVLDYKENGYCFWKTKIKKIKEIK